MNKFKYFFLVFSFVFINSSVFSQDIQNIPTSADTFLLEMSAKLLNTNNKHFRKSAEKLLESFSYKWNAGRFSKNQKQHIYYVEGLMKEKRMRTYPYYYQFINCLDGFIGIVQPEESVIAWLKSLEDLISQRTNKNFLKYLQQTDELFSENYIYNSRTFTWHFNKGQFYFKYDTVPSVVFEKLDLICSTRNDSSVINNTKGVFYPLSDKWIGASGKLAWNRVGLDEDEVYAKLNRYEIDLSGTEYAADSVWFYNNIFIKKKIGGKLTEKVLSSPPNSKTSFPRFESYFKNFEVKNIFQNINFKGGFSIKGADLFGTGGKDGYAYLEILRNNKRFAFVRTHGFLIKDEKIISDQSFVSIKFNGDSIYHPSCKMKYNNSKKEFIVMRALYPSYSSPFNDSFHNLDLYCEIIRWNMDESNISFEMIKGLQSESNASFVSINHFSDKEFYSLQGIDPINPIITLKRFSEYYNTRKVKVNVLADFIKKPREQAISMIMRLANKGFVVYNIDEKEAYIKDRLFDFLKAKAGLIDYDILKVDSKTKFNNASLDIENFDLTINGVSQIMLSDSQRVFVYPEDNKIIMKENRDFIFSGRVHAGLFDFFVHESSFEYDTFRLNLPKIDSLSFVVRYHKNDEFGRPVFVRVQNVIADLSGYLLIDHPNNKSGNRNFSHYPVFNSSNDSYVYYHYNSIKNGAYDKDKFYFYVSPFEIDSLVDFSTEGLGFDGYLASNGMFPEFNENLVVMPDYSLGFSHEIPDKGYPVYNNKGTFFDKIILNNNGLNGEGSLNYITSISTSNNYSFYPDSLIANCDNFEVMELADDPQFPSMISKMLDVYWLPDTNIMNVSIINDPFLMYNNGSEFEGDVELSPYGAKGNGVFQFSNAKIISSEFNFLHHELNADTSDFELLTKSGGELAILTNAYRTRIDFEKRRAWFNSTGRNSKVEFPFNEYICFMDEMEWDMDKDMMLLNNNTFNKISGLNKMSETELIDNDLSASEFVSVNREQDSLSFTAMSGKYDMTDYIVYAQGVKVIKVADAAIFPGNGKVKILKNAAMETLYDAGIIANTNSKYHRFYDADVNIYSKNNYHARGSYDYVDNNKTSQKIDMNIISVDSNGMTFANGIIPKYSVFFLSPEYMFTGDVHLEAEKKFLTFDGGFSINHDCYFANNESKISFKTSVNPKNIYIPVERKQYNVENELVNVGINYSVIEDEIYPAFLRKKKNTVDYSIISASGLINFDPVVEEYQVADNYRLKRKTLSGNYVSLSKRKCLLTGEGDINLGLNLGYMNLESIGKLMYYTIPDKVELKTVVFTDFFFDEKLLKMLSDSLNSSNLQGIDLSDRNYKLALIKKIGNQPATELISEYSLYGSAKKIPDELLHTFVFTDVNFLWDASTTSFVSKGLIGIGNIIKDQINKYVNGYFEIRKRKTGDEINFFLELSKNEWYFFSYRNNVMQAISSNDDFNKRLVDLSPGARILKIDKFEDQYEFVISTLGKKINFVRRMKKFFEEE